METTLLTLIPQGAMRCKKNYIIMAQLKCSECGQGFDNELEECPNCGCPASECEAEFIEEKTNMLNINKGGTTDTGYDNEKLILRYANWLFNVYIVLFTIYGVVIFIISCTVGSIWGAITAVAICVGTIIGAYVLRAFLRMLTNMSINLHEINMKLK